MINLIKNEFIKLLKKKSIYIVLIITLLFVVLINFLYKYTSNNSYSRYFEDDIDYYSQCLKSLDSNNPDEVEAYADIKTQLDIVTLISKYEFDTWQANIIPEKLGSSIGSINYYTYIEKNETALANAKQEYDKLVEILDSNNWKYFANIELKELNEKINLEENAKLAITDKYSLEESNYILNIYKIDKQVLEWRLSKDISYDNSFLNTALNDYANYSKHILSYERDNDSTYSAKLDYYNSLERANINKYYIENNITNIRDDDNRDILINLLNEYELFILIFIIMISGSIDGTLLLWNMSSYQCNTTIKGVYCCYTNALYQIDNDRVIVGHENGFYIVNIDKCVVEKTIEDESLGFVNCFLKLRDNNTILCGCGSGQLCYYDLITEKYSISKKRYYENI